MTDRQNMSPEVAHQYLVYRKSLPLQVKFQEVARAIGKTENLTCLEIGSTNALFSYRLRKLGGQWHTVILNEGLQASFTELLGENVSLMTDFKLPFKKKIFDLVILLDVLEYPKDAEAFIEECHGVLRPDGRLVVHTSRPKTWSLVNPLRDMLGLSPETAGLYRPGYAESDLFNVLKHGFDVHAMRSYSRLFVECVDLGVRSVEMRAARAGSPASRERVQRVYALASVFYWIAYQLDMFLFMTRGFRLVAAAKRRAWRPRNAPVLVDGRSISEAVLSRAAR